MGTFDIRQDAPGLLRAESLNITLKFDRTGPSTGRISWNIPAPAAGCTAETQSYAGMVVTIDTTPASTSKLPQDGTVYNADATANSNLFAGDKIGTSFVIGAFYGDKTTTFMDVTGLQPDTPYYVSGFPVDAQYRYFTEGVHAYSLELLNRGTAGTNGTQVVVMNPSGAVMGISPTEPTGLVPSTLYDFSVQVGIVPKPRSAVDSVDITPVAPTYTVVINGSDAATYQDLANAINKQLALVNGTVQGPTPPNTGSYYWNSATNTLYQWNGSTSVVVPNVIVQTTQPNTVAVNTYWFNPTADILYVYNGSSWLVVPVVKFATDPTAPIADSTYWFDGTHSYLWNGTTWCQVLTYSQATNPSLSPVIPAGSYWLDTSTLTLQRWNDALGMWNPAVAIQSDVDPSNPTGAYWFNDITNLLYAYNNPSPGWNLQSNVSISETAPATPAAGKLWYNPATETLSQWNAGTSHWDVRDVIVFGSDPTVRNFCDLWWNVATSTLYVWDALNSVWVAVTSLYMQGTDPAADPTFVDGTLWYNTTTTQLSVWGNQCFTAVPYISWATDPRTIAPGTAWFNTTTNVWSIRQSGNTWAAISPTVSSTDPTVLPGGAFWFNPSSSILQTWNGASWIPVTYTTAPPIPTKGALWFNSTTSTLMTWTGSAWVAGTPVATVQIDAHGNLLFTDTTVGSLSFIGLHDGTLFQALTAENLMHDTKPGVDEASDKPSYTEVGIGTDGTADERLNLANEIRYELGYPVIDVELTPQQIDYAITKALGELRTRSSAAYKRDYFFMRINPEVQRYYLTNKITGMHKIVDVLGVFRLTSSFMSSAHGAGVYGQIVLQQLYNMGTFDLLSYHIMSEYTKLMEVLFAARVTFTWNEATRELFLLHRFSMSEEAVAMECSVERTEQDLLNDRYLRPWIRRYTLATCRLILAETRGKFATLPGAGGGVTLNAAELRQAAASEIELCLAEIADYVVDRPEEWSRSDIIFG